MSEQIFKLSPHRDLQAYFLTPSAIAALSSASASGFTLSGKWRQQFDWAVVEWTRDNVFEHPSLRNLPDGDLSRLRLTYEEERTNVIPFESNLFPVIDWHRLRLWVTNADGGETVYYVKLYDQNPGQSLAVPVSGTTQAASATLTLVALPGTKRVGLAFSEEHYFYSPNSGDSLANIAAGIALGINNFSTRFTAISSGPSITVSCNGVSAEHSILGANGNRVTMYGFSEMSVPVWNKPSAVFSGGQFPSKYRVTVDFAALKGTTDADTVTRVPVPTTNVRKLRWSWSADLQPGQFNQTEFKVKVSQWSVTGANRVYSFAGPGSRRIEDSDGAVAYNGAWNLQTGNFSGSKIHFTATSGDSCTISYTETASHQLYLGLRRTPGAPSIRVTIDQAPAQIVVLTLPGEDVLIRYPLGRVAPGPHSITITNLGQGQTLYFDFLEIVYPSGFLPERPSSPQLALATDWDTYHSQSLAAERTAWLIDKLGFTGRVNHYVGALWFYEIVRTGTRYASLTVTFQYTVTNASPLLTFALAARQENLRSHDTRTEISHLVLPDDDSATIAQAIAGLINVGTNLVWASVSGSQLTLNARAMGVAGNGVGFMLIAGPPNFVVSAPSTALSGGIDGTPFAVPSDNGGLNDTFSAAAAFWRTDLTAVPRINRAARDWHAAFFAALKSYGIDVVAAFSTELGNGDPASSVGIAQRYPNGTPVVLNTPAIQTNFSPACLAYWTQVYLDMASLQNGAGFVPYLQSGEVQWWYFPLAGVGMTFYDSFTQRQFTAKYGAPMQTILSNTADPSAYRNEVEFLPTLIGAYTGSIRSALQRSFPGCRYEVLYPTDVNDTPLNRLINYPAADWTSANLTCLKTESFGFTGASDLISCTRSMSTSAAKGFPNSQRSHLVGISDAWSAWLREVDIAQSQGVESVVLFALDQYCLIGYPPPPFVNSTGSSRQG